MATERFARIDDNNIVQEVMIIDSNDYDGDAEHNSAKRCAVLTGFPIENFKKCNFGPDEATGVSSYRGVTPSVGVTVWTKLFNYLEHHLHLTQVGLLIMQQVLMNLQ